MSDSIVLPCGYDLHVHLREGEVLKKVLPMTARQFAGVVVMPNLVPPVTTVERAVAYKAEILDALRQQPIGHDFVPLMTAYLTDETSPKELISGFREWAWAAAKLYPANATTNSAQGVTDVRKLGAVFKAMEEADMPLLVHGELIRYDGRRVDPFDREVLFLKMVLGPLRVEFPRLRIVLEHVTNKESVEYIMAQDDGRIGATITAHHLWISREDLFEGGLRPHLYCLPPAKRERHRLALREAATSGDRRFFLGTDSAPHLSLRKESECCPGGVFTANAALEYYAEVFDQMGALDERFSAFVSENGRKFYDLPQPSRSVTLVREEWEIDSPFYVPSENGYRQIHPFLCGGDGLKNSVLHWKMKE